MQLLRTSPIFLKVGDKVISHGATFEVMHITEAPCDVPGGVRVAACTSRLVGAATGAIPKCWFCTKQSLIDRGCLWAVALPDGDYWNVQGNAHASVHKIIS